MKQSSVFVLISIFLMGFNSFAEGRKCGTEDVTNLEKIMFVNPLAALDNKVQTETLDSYVHVVSTKPVAESAILEQMQVVNDAYAKMGFSFDLKSIDVITDESIIRSFSGSTSQANGAKASLRKGNARALNIYIGDLRGGLLGWATFPWNYETQPDIDGVVITSTSLPGGSAPFDKGHTLTHEIGHWFGLYHTFQGGCSGEGDYVDDTPAHPRPTYGCPTATASTCGDRTEIIPVANFMNYSDDACMSEFSPLQDVRANAAHSVFRTAFHF